MLRRLLPHRNEALRAVALVAARGEALAPGLARLAGDDRLLGPWARRLVRAAERCARSGRAGTGTVLARAGLLEMDEATFVDEAEQAGDAAAALRHLALQGGFRVPGLHLVEWFPLWLLGTMLLAILGMNLFAGLLGFDTVIDELGIRTRWLATLVFDVGPVTLLLPAVVLLVLVYSVLRATGWFPGGLALLRRCWYLAIAQDACLLRMLRCARQRAALARLPQVEPSGSWWSVERQVRHHWLQLFLPGTPPNYKALLQSTDEPDALLRCAGFLPADREPDPEEWDRLLRATSRRLRERLAARLGLYRFILVAAFVLMWLLMFHNALGSFMGWM